MAALAKPVSGKRRISVPKPLWIGIGGIALIAIIILILKFSGKTGEDSASSAMMIPTVNWGETAVIHTPQKTNTTGQTTATQKASGYADPTMYDDFNNSAYDGSYNKSLWFADSNSNNSVINQNDGQLSIKVSGQSENGLGRKYSKIVKPTFFEARLYLDPQTTNNGAFMFIELNNDIGYSLCNLGRTGDHAQQITCESEYYGKKVQAKLNLAGILPNWHILRLEIDTETMIISYIVDGKKVGYFDPKESIPDHLNDFKPSTYYFYVGLVNFDMGLGYVDYVRMGAIEDDPTVEAIELSPTPGTTSDPTMYDDFDNAAYNGSYNRSLWGFDGDSKDFFIGQSDGNLSININDNAGVGLYTSRGLNISEPTFFEARVYLDPKTTNKGCHLYIELSNNQGYSNCGIFRTGDYAQQVQCWSDYYGKQIDANLDLTGILPDWHILRFEVEPETMTISYVIDGEALDSINLKETFPTNFRLLKDVQFNVGIGMNNYGPADEPVGYIDYVRTGELAP